MAKKFTMRMSDFELATRGKCAFIPTDTIRNRLRDIKLKNTHKNRMLVSGAVIDNPDFFKLLNIKFSKQLDEVREVLIDGMEHSENKYLFFTTLQAALFLMLDEKIPFEYDKTITVDTVTDEEEIERFDKVLETLAHSVNEISKSLRSLNEKIDNEEDDEI